MTSAVDGDVRARAWVAHLRRGGTTRWTSFPAPADHTDHASDGGDDAGALLPGAAQLELARRLNEHAACATGAAHRALVDRVLAASPVGRGPSEQPLVDGPVPRFGSRPVDPSTLPAKQMLRTAVGVLAETVVASGAAPDAQDAPDAQPAPGLGARLRGLVRGYALAGDPVLVHEAAQALRLAGRSPGSTPRTAVVLGGDLHLLLADVWAWRVTHGASVPWERWLERHAREDRLPRPADLAALAAHWAGRIGRRRVHVALGRAAVGQGAGVLGVRRLPAYDELPRLSRAALDLLRETNLVLRLMVPNDRHRALLRTVLVPMLAAETGPPPAVPDHLAAWLARREGEQRAALAAGGYAQHGEPAPPVPAGGVRDDDVLVVALRALLRTRTEVA